MADFRQIKIDEKYQESQKKGLSLKNLKKNPRIEEIKVEDEKFFAYEKQRSHN